MEKAKIGIVPTWNYTADRPFLNTFSFVNNYPKRLREAGATAQGILVADGIFTEEEVSDFDGFLFPGGSTIKPYHLLIMHYAITNNKPVLGICMGLQIMGAYDYITAQLKHRGSKVDYQTIKDYYVPLIDDETWFLKKIQNHDKASTFYDSSVPKASHLVHIIPNTVLAEIYEKSIISEPSVHRHALKNELINFNINAMSSDGVIEGIEIKDKTKFVLGVEFHPELEEKNQKLFERFIYEILKRK